MSSCTAFNGKNLIASGDVREVVLKSKEVLDRDEHAQILIFDDISSEQIEADFRGTVADVAQRLEDRAAGAHAEARRPGRPKLGVVAREVTLLPRHWEWLAKQPGGASVALRKLVEHGIKTNRGQEGVRRSQDVTYRFMSAMAGDEPGFEEAIRALFGRQQHRFVELIGPWPADIRNHANKLAVGAFVESELPHAI
ncbi:MAG: DUF2239 family protein [Bryobacteraceae bacterium]